MEPWQIAAAALAALTLGARLCQGWRRRLRSEWDDAQSGVRTTVFERSLSDPVTAPNCDSNRDVEARINNRLEALDQLILEADREIERLQILLSQSRRSFAANRELTREEQQRGFALREAGLSLEEIAGCLTVPPASVERALDEWRDSDRRAA